MPDTTTANYGWTKPEVGASPDSWGTKLNADLDAIDSQMNATAASVAAAELAGQRLYFRNRLINGSARIDQRHGGLAVTLGSTIAYGLDRWKAMHGASAGAATLQQSVGGGPSAHGLPDCVTYAVTAGAGAAASDQWLLEQDIEGVMFADALFGTANAKAVTLSFWVQSSSGAGGTFCGALQNRDETRSYPFTFTINDNDVWEYKTITVPGDTIGTWPTDATVGLRVMFDLGSGSNFEATAGVWTGANRLRVSGGAMPSSSTGWTVSFTGVQLEIGTQATDWETRPYDDELRHCQRYFEIMTLGAGLPATPNYSSYGYVAWIYKTTKRAAPTVINAGAGANLAGLYSAGVDGVVGYETAGNTPCFGAASTADAEL
jgi:hypothetical protein